MFNVEKKKSLVMKTKTRMTNYQLNIQRQFELQDFQTETVILSRLAFYLGFSYSNINLNVSFIYRCVTLLSFLSYLSSLNISRRICV